MNPYLQPSYVILILGMVYFLVIGVTSCFIELNPSIIVTMLPVVISMMIAGVSRVE